MPHGERVPKLDKQQRTVLQELGAGELLALVLEPLRAKVAQMGLEENAAELIELLEMERAGQTSVLKNNKKHPKLHCIRKIMGRMSIAGLVGIAGYSQTGTDFRDRLTGAVEKLRGQLQWRGMRLLSWSSERKRLGGYWQGMAMNAAGLRAGNWRGALHRTNLGYFDSGSSNIDGLGQSGADGRFMVVAVEAWKENAAVRSLSCWV